MTGLPLGALGGTGLGGLGGGGVPGALAGLAGTGLGGGYGPGAGYGPSTLSTALGGLAGPGGPLGPASGALVPATGYSPGYGSPMRSRGMYDDPNYGYGYGSPMRGGYGYGDMYTPMAGQLFGPSVNNFMLRGPGELGPIPSRYPHAFYGNAKDWTPTAYSGYPGGGRFSGRGPIPVPAFDVGPASPPVGHRDFGGVWGVDKWGRAHWNEVPDLTGHDVYGNNNRYRYQGRNLGYGSGYGGYQSYGYGGYGGGYGGYGGYPGYGRGSPYGSRGRLLSY